MLGQSGLRVSELALGAISKPKIFPKTAMPAACVALYTSPDEKSPQPN